MRTVPDARAQIDRVYREEYGRVVASLARRFDDLDLAEDQLYDVTPTWSSH